jgi:dTMP kinase
LKKAKGKLVVIEAPDGSGKKTQAELLFNRLKEEGYQVRKVEFPNYRSPSSSLVKMYLRGEFGENPNKVNPYAASAFYAVDRFASFQKEWQGFYIEGGMIIADRYTTSNLIHQAVKFTDEKEKEKYLDWVWDFEFNRLALPVPDVVFFLDMPPDFSEKLIAMRKNKFTGKGQKDIHEINKDYLRESYKNACWIAEKYNWVKIECVQNNEVKPIAEIHENLYFLLKKYL